MAGGLLRLDPRAFYERARQESLALVRGTEGGAEGGGREGGEGEGEGEGEGGGVSGADCSSFSGGSKGAARAAGAAGAAGAGHGAVAAATATAAEREEEACRDDFVARCVGRTAGIGAQKRPAPARAPSPEPPGEAEETVVRGTDAPVGVGGEAVGDGAAEPDNARSTRARTGESHARST